MNTIKQLLDDRSSYLMGIKLSFNKTQTTVPLFPNGYTRFLSKFFKLINVFYWFVFLLP